MKILAKILPEMDLLQSLKLILDLRLETTSTWSPHFLVTLSLFTHDNVPASLKNFALF